MANHPNGLMQDSTRGSRDVPAGGEIHGSIGPWIVP